VDSLITFSDALKLLRRDTTFLRNLIKYFRIPSAVVDGVLCLNKPYFMRVATSLNLIKPEKKNTADETTEAKDGNKKKTDKSSGNKPSRSNRKRPRKNRN